MKIQINKYIVIYKDINSINDVFDCESLKICKKVALELIRGQRFFQQKISNEIHRTGIVLIIDIHSGEIVYNRKCTKFQQP